MTKDTPTTQNIQNRFSELSEMIRNFIEDNTNTKEEKKQIFELIHQDCKKKGNEYSSEDLS
jgi:hypothetical protein